ncbi:MAG TPA: hypothetical protein VLA02_03555 [Reyranella sp.]|nr:hypothetical protein [Reyranella sp.]
MRRILALAAGLLAPGPTQGGPATLTQDRADLRVHTIMIGLRYEL